MATSLRDIFFSFALVGLFIVATITFVGQFQVENNAEISIYDNEVINRTLGDFNTNLDQDATNLTGQKNTFDAEIPERGFGTLLIFSIVTVAQSFVNGIITTYNTLVVLPASVLGIPSIVMNVLTSILIVSMVLLSWRVIRLGS